MKKWLIMLSILLTVGLLTACGNSNNGNGGAGKKTLVMGTSADYPPYESTETSKGNDIVGFDVDIAKYITKKLGYNLQIKNMQFNGLVAALQTKRVDFVMAGMTPTPSREKNVDFSGIYYASHQMILTRDDENIHKLSDLKGKTVGVQAGAIQEQEALKINKKYPINIKRLDTMNVIVEDLKTKRLDAVVIEDSVAAGFMKTNKNLRDFVIPGETSAGSAIAFPKGSNLKKPFNQELNKMKKNGELDKLTKKWFNVSAK